MHRRYEPLKYKNNRMQRKLDPDQAERLMAELNRMFDHIFKSAQLSTAALCQPRSSTGMVNEARACSKPN